MPISYRNIGDCIGPLLLNNEKRLCHRYCCSFPDKPPITKNDVGTTALGEEPKRFICKLGYRTLTHYFPPNSSIVSLLDGSASTNFDMAAINFGFVAICISSKAACEHYKFY